MIYIHELYIFMKALKGDEASSLHKLFHSFIQYWYYFFKFFLNNLHSKLGFRHDKNISESLELFLRRSDVICASVRQRQNEIYLFTINCFFLYLILSGDCGIRRHCLAKNVGRLLHTEHQKEDFLLKRQFAGTNENIIDDIIIILGWKCF